MWYDTKGSNFLNYLWRAIISVSTNRFSAKIDLLGLIFHINWFLWNLIARLLVNYFFFKNQYFIKKNDNLLQQMVFLPKIGSFWLLNKPQTSSKATFFCVKDTSMPVMMNVVTKVGWPSFYEKFFFEFSNFF